MKVLGRLEWMISVSAPAENFLSPHGRSMEPSDKPQNASLQRLIALFQEAGFSIAEPVFSEPSGKSYLVVFQSNKRCIKFSDDGRDLFVWVAVIQTSGPKVWHRIRHVCQVLVDDRRIEYNPATALVDVEGIARFFIREHDRIANLFSSYTPAELASRIRRVEEKERSTALRSMGIDYKAP